MKQMLITTSWDDGHKLDLRLAKLLKKYEIAGTFYIAPQDHEFGSADRLTNKDIKKLATDFEIGAHTMTHPRLTKVDDSVAKSEILDSKHYLEVLTGRTITSFCYPGGAYRARHSAMVRAAGFKLARTVKRFKSSWSNAMEMPTSIHAYRHYSDAWQIVKIARFDPIRFINYLLNWDQLAIAVFNQTETTGNVFHLWGHSWEIDRRGDWDRLEMVLSYIQAHSDPVQRVPNNYFSAARRPKLLLAAPYFYPRVGGLEIYAFEMAKTAVKNGYDVSVITSGTAKNIQEDDIGGIHVYRLPVQRTIMSNTPVSLRWPRMIKHILAREQPDLINAHMPVPYLSELVVKYAGKVPTIVTYHSASLKKGKPVLDLFIGLYERFILARSFKRATRIVCSSDFIRIGFLKKYAYKSLTITPGVDEKLFRPAPGSEHTGNILFIGDFRAAGKGLHHLKQAVKRVPGANLRAVGYGPQTPSERTTYLGPMGRSELVKEIQTASLVVLPSINKSESFGMVLIEAMACGVAVIGSDIGGISSVIDDGQNGLLVPPGNVKKLAESIKRLLDDSALRQRLAEAGRAHVLKNYTWKSQSAGFLEVCRTTDNPYVLHVTPYYPPHLGGMENVVAELAGEMSNQHFPVRVITSNIGNVKRQVPHDQGLVVDRLHSSTIAGLPLLWNLPLRLLRIPRPNVMHIHVAQAVTPEIALLVAKLRRIPVVMHFHLDVDASGRFGFIFLLYKRFVLGPTLRGADRVIAFSPEQRALLVRKHRVQEQRISIVPNGISQLFLAANQPLHPRNPIPVILYVGRLAPQKRLERLIAAMPLLKVRARLILVGDGDEREKLENQVRRLQLTNVHFAGRKSAAEIKAIHGQADVFALSSDREGMPLVALEAMASGLPVVGSDVTGIRELVDGVGMLVKDPSPESFAAAFDTLLAHPDMLKQFAHRSSLAARQYTWPKIVSLLEQQVYEQAGA